jgi:hypothetical protein
MPGRFGLTDDTGCAIRSLYIYILLSAQPMAMLGKMAAAAAAAADFIIRIPAP